MFVYSSLRILIHCDARKDYSWWTYFRLDTCVIYCFLHVLPLSIYFFFEIHVILWQMIFWQIWCVRWKNQIFILNEWSEEWINIQIMHHTYINAINKIVMEMKCNKPLRTSKDSHSLSNVTYNANWFVCTNCLERQSTRHRTKTLIEKQSGLIIHKSEVLNRNVYSSSFSKQKHNELMSTSSSDSKSVFSFTENESDGKEKWSKNNNVILVIGILAVHHSSRIAEDMEIVML